MSVRPRLVWTSSWLYSSGDGHWVRQNISLSRVRERLVMGAGLVEADRMGGWGEEEDDEVRIGGDAEEERVGG